MIVFVGVVAALARVVAEVNQKGLAKGLTSVVLPLSKAIEREVESMKMPLLVVCLTASDSSRYRPRLAELLPVVGSHSSGGGFLAASLAGCPIWDGTQQWNLYFPGHLDSLTGADLMRCLCVRTAGMKFGFCVMTMAGLPYWWYPGYGYVDGRYPDDGYSDEDAYNDSAPAYGDQYRQDLAMKVQWALSQRDYYDGPNDGVIGPDGTRAIRAFQEAQRLPASGRIAPQRLNSFKATSSTSLPKTELRTAGFLEANCIPSI